MAELQTLARPYAKAVFELGREGGNLKDWSARLATIAAAVQVPETAALIGHPRVTRQMLSAALGKSLAASLGHDGQGLAQLLAENGRLTLAPLIAEQFEALRAAAESRVDVEITSAAEVSGAQRSALGAALGERLHREVAIDWKTDESLIAGAVVRAGDLVIDGSVSGELARMKSALTQ
ncbi:MAG: synthase subunit delta [Hydrocarboniphaga sp.]|uniref:F0F1 ATP synthase subunit delta n=1 Tax=Hydrocarboniphaga sp. TaxID=2033016 RepID=UPI002604EAC8|nr:F0F1 ATP synthase subunit delta [Hydrocarboniphaga sp.]MDB5973022.1 synthase subunit delta [Hydrocarboniphaga sp.]